VIDNQLDGIMFWELTHDTKDGLVDVIYNLKKNSVSKANQK
jgi:GH18 family chitinase